MFASSGPTSAAYSTPTKQATFSASAEAGPSRARPAASSPAYSSRRHSLYGIEDRIIIESSGSRIWKVGFSGEPDPRAVFWAQDDSDREGGEMWDIDLGRIRDTRGDRQEASRLIGVRIMKKLRETFIKHLMTDPKSRKVIVTENTFLPTFVKDHIARVLFDNLQVPSVSFTSSSLLALAACGRVTGLVIDCSWLETTVTPVYHSRPLYHLAHSSRLAGRALHSRLRALLHRSGTYIPPPTSLGSLEDRRPISPVPLTILSDRVVERVLTEGCFVGEVFTSGDRGDYVDVDDWPVGEEERDDLHRVEALALRRRYSASSSATDIRFSIPPEAGASRDLGSGTLVVPGWIRERAAEVLFEEDDFGETTGLPDLVLGCLLKLPVDLRLPMTSAILVTGGTASSPGFIHRLRVALHHLLLPPSIEALETAQPLHSPAARKAERKAWRRRHFEPYKALYGLASKIAILNDPAALDGDGSSAGGKAPRWTPGLMSWVGGSLAGALKTSGPDLLREDYDGLCAESLVRADAYRTALDEAEVEVAALVGLDVEELLPGMALDGLSGKRKRGYHEGPRLGDWAQGPIKAG